MFEEQIEHIYFINGDGDSNTERTKCKNYSIDILKDYAKPTEENIQLFYRPFRKTGSYRRVKVEKLVCMTKCELDGEKWRKHPNYNIHVSNFGRVLEGGEILNQFEEKVFKGNSPHDGYLQVKIQGLENEPQYLYKLVAQTWLLKNNDENCIWDIHHINNNGYENTPENLIILRRCHHRIIHPFMKKCNECKHEHTTVRG